MRPAALREQTRSQAQGASGKLKTRLSKGEKRNRKWMAEIVTVYELAPEPRTAVDILPAPDTPAPAARTRPKAKNKWLTASVSDDASAVIAEMFNEADRRDPKHKLAWVALVDGNNHHCDTRSHVTREHTQDWRFGGCDVVSVVPGPCSAACPHADVRRPVLAGRGSKLGGKPKGRPFPSGQPQARGSPDG